MELPWKALASPDLKVSADELEACWLVGLQACRLALAGSTRTRVARTMLTAVRSLPTFCFSRLARLQWTNTGCTTPKLEGLPADITECNPALSWGFTLGECTLQFALIGSLTPQQMMVRTVPITRYVSSSRLVSESPRSN